MKLALIHNPRSGYNRRHPERVPAAAAKAGIACWSATGPDDFLPAMRAVADTKPDVLIINGGDGTVDAVVTCLRRSALFATEPALAVLPGGSTNMIARDIGLAGQPEQALQRLARAALAGERGETLRRAPFAIHAADGTPGPLGFFFAGGALPPVLRQTQQKSHPRGFVGRGGEALALLRATLRLLAGDLRRDALMKPGTVSWCVDPSGAAIVEQEELVLYFVTTLDRLVLGLRPGQPRPGLRFLALRYPYRAILASVSRLLRGTAFHELDGNMIFRSGERVRLSFSGEAVLDGEALPVASGITTVEIELQPPLTFWRIQAC